MTKAKAYYYTNFDFGVPLTKVDVDQEFNNVQWLNSSMHYLNLYTYLPNIYQLKLQLYLALSKTFHPTQTPRPLSKTFHPTQTSRLLILSKLLMPTSTSKTNIYPCLVLSHVIYHSQVPLQLIPTYNVTIASHQEIHKISIP